MSGISLSLLVFRHRIKHITDATWHALCSQEYAERWWKIVPEDEKPQNISQYPDDRRYPFGAIKISPKEFIDSNDKHSLIHIENTIIRIGGVFEAYMADLIGRCIRLKPDLLSTSEMEFLVSDLVQPDALASPLTWLSREYVQKMVRNKSHSKLIKRFGNMIKRDIASANPDSYNLWNKFILLRNTIVHAAGLVSPELSLSWSEEFPCSGVPVKLDAKFIISMHKTAYDLANTIDNFALDIVIGKSDAELMARELFVLHGIDDSPEISRQITHVLSEKFSKGEVEAALAKQRREEQDPADEFPMIREWLRHPHDMT